MSLLVLVAYLFFLCLFHCLEFLVELHCPSPLDQLLFCPSGYDLIKDYWKVRIMARFKHTLEALEKPPLAYPPSASSQQESVL